MDKHSEQHLDRLAEKVIKESTLVSPSMDFTATIMKQVKTVSKESSIAYKPLISKYVWIAIIASLIGLSIYVMYNNSGNSGWLSTLDLGFLSENKVAETLSGITFSKSLVYAVGFLGLMLLIQIPMLKNYHSKQFEI